MDARCPSHWLGPCCGLCVVSGELVATGDASFFVDEDSLFLLFLLLQARRDVKKNGSHRNFDNIAAFGQVSGERCLLQWQEIHM